MIFCPISGRFFTAFRMTEKSDEMKPHNYYVYMMTNKTHSVVYTGVTNDLIRRTYEHRSGEVAGFTKIYRAKKLIYFEYFDYIEAAIAREKQLKGWKRCKKDALISGNNPEWRDLTDLI